MNGNLSIVRVLMAGSGIVLAVMAAGSSHEVPFPQGYRSWQHVKSVVAGPGSKSFAAEGGKIFQFYANPAAIEGYRTGKFPNGAIIVRETLRAIAGEGQTAGMFAEGERTALDVMTKDDRLYGDTGGWGFETFDKNSNRAGEKARAQCYACHAKQKDRDFVFSSMAVSAGAGTPYPEGYRHWTFLHSTMVPPTFDVFASKPCEKPCMGGIFHFYANEKAMQGLRTGSYADGAVIAEEMLEWLSGAGGSAKEGPRRLIGVMVKDSQRYSSTGGWGYGSFDDGSTTDKLGAKQREECYQCHLSRKDQGYVFTEYRER